MADAWQTWHDVTLQAAVDTYSDHRDTGRTELGWSNSPRRPPLLHHLPQPSRLARRACSLHRRQYEAELSRLAAAAGIRPGQLLRLAGGSSSLAAKSRTAAGLRAAVAAAAASVAGGGGRSAAMAAAAAAAAGVSGQPGLGGSSPARGAGSGSGRAGAGSRVMATARALAGVGSSPVR